MKKFADVIKRILASFAVSALSVLGAGAVAGVETWKAALMAGIGGTAAILESLSRAYLNDGRLTAEEINTTFAQKNKKAR